MEERWLNESAPNCKSVVSGFESGSSSAHGKLYQSPGGLPPGDGTVRGLASEGRQKYTMWYTKPPKYLKKKKLVQLIWNSFQFGLSGFPVKQGLLHRLSEAESTIEQMNAKLHQLEKNKQKIQSELGRYILH